MNTFKTFLVAIALAVAVAEEFNLSRQIESPGHVRSRDLKKSDKKKDKDTSDDKDDEDRADAAVGGPALVPAPAPAPGGSAVGQEIDRSNGEEFGAGSALDVALQVDRQASNGVVFSDGKTVTFGGLFEFFPCVSFEPDTIQAKATDYRSDAQCATNSCSGGCCRELDFWLTCDEDNNHPNRKCVCNANTYKHLSAVPGLPPPVDVPAGNDGDRAGSLGSGQGGAAGGQDTNRTVVGDLDDPAVDTPVANTNATNTTNPPNSTNTTNPVAGAEDINPTGSNTTTSNSTERTPAYPDPDFCFPNFAGQNWGIHPEDSSSLPEGMSPGDCTSDSHCLPSAVEGAPVCCT